jgi:F-type H+-transporting ATPase subunit a
MADPVLHIKDAYYFEVPKLLAPANYKQLKDFPEVWIKLDPEFQHAELHALHHELEAAGFSLPPEAECEHDWHEWAHADHANFAKPFDQFLQEKYAARVQEYQDWKSARVAATQQKNDQRAEAIAREAPIDDYLRQLGKDDAYDQYIVTRHSPGGEAKWKAIREKTGNYAAIRKYRETHEWSQAKVNAYNEKLSGKILIPQPFAELRNLYERESGFAISKFLLIEIFVGLVIVLIFHQLAQRVADGKPPKGKLWNFFEMFLVFIRDQIARPVLGGHDHGADHGHEHAGEGHAGEGHKAEHAHAAHEHSHAPAAHAHAAHADPAQKFLPLLWTIFFFVLGCNLMGMVPWAGSPTAAFGVTFALAVVTFATVGYFGMRQFGVLGFFANQVPGMDLPWYMAIVIKPMILAIELLGLCIKHLVLAIRLLANMVAGHLVILAVMGLAFGAEAALHFAAPTTPSWQWWVTATIAVIGAAAFNVLELFVAFLQAYVFTFLSTLFIGAAIHKH